MTINSHFKSNDYIEIHQIPAIKIKKSTPSHQVASLVFKELNLNYSIEQKPFCKGTIKRIYQALNKDSGEEVVVSEFRSWKMPDYPESSLPTNWIEKYALTKERFNRIKKIEGILPLYKLLQVKIDANSFYQFIIEKNCKLGNLAQIWQNSCFSPSQVIFYTEQILDIVRSAHHQKLIINDLKLDNIFVDDQGQTLYLGDIEAIRYEDEVNCSNSENHLMGSTQYLSPEIFCFPEQLHKPILKDLWALGLSLAFLWDFTADGSNTEKLFNHLEALNKERIYANKPYQLDFFEEISKLLEGLPSFISKMLTVDPKNRFQSIDEVIDAFNEEVLDQSSETETLSTSTSDGLEDSSSSIEEIYSKSFDSDCE